jgi:hypothetical protein
MVLAQFVPSAQVPAGPQLAGPVMKELVQPGGSAGAVTPSKFSARVMNRPHGVGEGVGDGDGVTGCTSNDPMSMRPLKARGRPR